MIHTVLIHIAYESSPSYAINSHKSHINVRWIIVHNFSIASWDFPTKQVKSLHCGMGAKKAQGEYPKKKLMFRVKQQWVSGGAGCRWRRLVMLLLSVWNFENSTHKLSFRHSQRQRRSPHTKPLRAAFKNATREIKYYSKSSVIHSMETPGGYLFSGFYPLNSSFIDVCLTQFMYFALQYIV